MSPQYLYAETYVRAGDLDNGGVWNKAGSPYIIEDDIRVTNGNVLTIESGVSVISVSSSDYNSAPYAITFDGGDLNISGTADEPVNIQGLYGIYFVHSNSTIENAIFDNSFLNFNQSTSTILNSIIKNAMWGIFAKGSRIAIENSKILNNTYGISSNKYVVGPVLMYQQDKGLPDSSNGIGGIGNALSDMNEILIDTTQNGISIRNSEIVGNTKYGIYNKTLNPVSAENNWWGAETGPKTSTSSNGDMVYGLVNYSPWKEKLVEEVPCCSNVLFIPGIEASRLYRDVKQYLGTTTEQMWEPYGNSHVKDLSLSETGYSIDKTVYTKDILDSAYDLKDIYMSFVTMMNGVVADKTINQWLAYPYDWRMSTEDIALGLTKLSTTTVSLIESVESLAKSSKTGKIIIIAHSNGGLVAKSLIKALEDKGESGLVEKIINIAVPELGTPKAILSMLHGYDQSIAGGIIASEKTARNLSQNMLGAYGLLPSRKFFEINPIKVISDNYSGSKLLASTYDAMKSFLLNGPFSMKKSKDTNIPLSLNEFMLSKADSLHSSIDYWKPASTTRTLSLFGWGLPTSDGVLYEKDDHCKYDTDCAVSYIPTVTKRGDGTVLVDSNSNISDRSLFINLKLFNDDTKNEVNHADVLEAPPALDFVKKEISNTQKNNDYGKYITDTEPIDTERWLTLKIFSPVDIDVYDKEGNHTGRIENNNINLKPYESKIPNSYYNEFSGKKIVILPYDNDYQMVLKGNDAGAVIIKAEVEQYETVIASTTFSEMPVTPLTNIELIISTSTDSFSTSSVMNMDIDGDGITDFVNHSNEYFGSTTLGAIADYVTYIESIRKAILSLGLNPKEEKRWLDKIDKINKDFEKKNYKKAHKLIKKLSKEKFNKRNLTEAQRQAILDFFDKTLDEFEMVVRNK